MSLFERWILPPLLDLAMRQRQLAPYRRAVVPTAGGRVLEVGIGSGLNLAFYGQAAELVIGLDPSDRLLAMARRRAATIQVPAELVQGSAAAIPLPDAAVDTVVMTWTLCSVPDASAALGEIRRVLKPGGALRFVEHGLSPEPEVARWQRRLTPAWRHLTGGCHLDRRVDTLIRDAGFDIAELATGYARGPRTMAYMFQGSARPRR